MLFSRKSNILTIGKDVLIVFFSILDGLTKGSFKCILTHTDRKSILKVDFIQGVQHVSIDGVSVNVSGLKAVVNSIAEKPAEKEIVRVGSGHYAYHFKSDENLIIINVSNVH